MLSTSASVDRLGTGMSMKRTMMTTTSSFRPTTQISLGILSLTSSINPTPTLKSTYLPDFEKTYRTLDFGVAGRKGIHYENKAIEASQKYRSTIVNSYE